MDWQMLAWSRLADAAAGGLIVLVAGSLAARLCRQPVRRTRLVVLTLLGGVAVPCLGALPLGPRWSARLPEIPALPRPHVDVATFPAVAGGPLRPSEAVIPAALALDERPIEPSMEATARESAGDPASRVEPDRATGWDLASARTTLLVCYLIAAAGWALWWLVGQFVLWRVTRSARPVPEAIRDVFLELAGPAGEPVALLESERIASPFTYTWRRPVIVLPEPLCDGFQPGALRYVLAHEWSHVERRDAWAWNLAWLAGLVLLYQPLFWWLRRQLRLCQDYLADARAAAAGSAEDYAAFLVRLARAQRSSPAVPALGIGDRRSNLSRRVMMLVQDHAPLEHRCRAAWSLGATLAAAVVIVVASGFRLGLAATPDDEPAPKVVPAAKKDAAKPPADSKKEEPLHYSGSVVDKDTRKPIPGATVVVRRSIYRSTENRVLEESRHTTDADGKYSFTIPPEQYNSPYLYIELDVEHPDYATRAGFGYALGMTRKNEKLNERPFFEMIELRAAKPINGRVETPDGRPAAGVELLAYSRTDKVSRGHFEYGSFARAKTDDQGRFRLPITTPGRGVYWILPKDYAPDLFLLPEGKRGDVGTIALKQGAAVKGRVLDVRGKPLAGVFVEVDRERGKGPEFEALGQMMVADAIRRTAETDAEGRFTFGPLGPGEYHVKPIDVNYSSDRSAGWTRRELPGVFAPTKVTIEEGKAPDPLEVRASPHVVVEGRWLDSQGKPKGGWGSFVFGRIDGAFWNAQTHPDAEGRFSLKVPHGLEEVQVDISTNEHASMRHRIGKDAPLTEGRTLKLGTLDHDVKDIEIVRYVAPIIVINATTKDGKQVKDFKATVAYIGDGPDGRKDVSVVGGPPRKDTIQDEQYDGRYRTSQLLPDKEVTVTVTADGYSEASRNLTLPEGKTEEVTLILEPKSEKPEAEKAKSPPEADK